MAAIDVKANREVLVARSAKRERSLFGSGSDLGYGISAEVDGPGGSLVRLVAFLDALPTERAMIEMYSNALRRDIALIYDPETVRIR